MGERRTTPGIRKRGDGLWEVRVSTGKSGPDGRYGQVSRSVNGTLRDAQIRRGELLAEVRSGALDTRPKTQSFGDLLDAYLTAKTVEGLSPSTLTRYRHAAAHLRPLGARPLNQIDVAALEGIYGAMTAAGQSGASVRKVHQVAAGALDLAVRHRKLATNPAHDARPPKVAAPNTDAPDVGTVRKLLDAAADDPSFAALLRLGVVTGARRGELVALRWSDLEGSRLSICRTLVHGAHEVIERPQTKTGNRRTITLDSATVAALVAERDRCVALCADIGTPFHPDGFMFGLEPDGTAAYRPDAITARFARLCRKVGVSGVSFYSATRHFCASELVAAGEDPVTIANRLGHDVRVLLSRYAHVRPARDVAIAATMATVLG